MRIKICGITRLDQAQAIVELGATALGFICVRESPRYISPPHIAEIVKELSGDVDKIGVFVNTSVTNIYTIVRETGLTGVQCHGDEPPEFCEQIREILPDIEIIKALRIKNEESLREASRYFNSVDTLLLDAYHPEARGGTGKTLNWQGLAEFRPPLPWLLAGGLRPDNILEALSQLSPDGIDLSSGVERSPGDKDLDKVAELFRNLKALEI